MQPIFRHTGASHVALDKAQLAVRDALQRKLDRGLYRLAEAPCLCGSADDVAVSETDRYGLRLRTVICRRCGLLRTNPRLDGASLDAFYANEYRDLYMGAQYGDMQSYFDDMVLRGNAVLKLMRERMPGLMLEGLKVLEIGCSAGGVLLPFLRGGAVVKGLDYDRRYLDFGNSVNPALNLNLGGLKTLGNERDKYDIVLLNHVLEHLPDPAGAVKSVEGVLKSGGIFYLSVPDLRNPGYYLSLTKSFLGSLHIGHLYHFTENTLRRLLGGFDVVYIDDDIKAICRKRASGDFAESPAVPSDFTGNIEYIRRYERSLPGMIKRLPLIIRNYRTAYRLVFCKGKRGAGIK